MTDPQQPQPSEEEVRAALEEQLRQLTVDDMLLESAVSLINLGGRKAGVAPGTEDERDLDQVRRAVDAVRALLPLLEQGKHAEQLGPLRDALARLQMAYAQTAGPGSSLLPSCGGSWGFSDAGSCWPAVWA